MRTPKDQRPLNNQILGGTNSPPQYFPQKNNVFTSLQKSISMKKYILFLLLFGCLSINAQGLLIDDFKTGALPLTETTIVDNVNKPFKVQTGTSIYGGIRRITYYNSQNIYGQKIAVSVLNKEGLFVVSSGYKASNGIELLYGLDAKGNSNPLGIDITKFKNMKIEFDGSNKPLNFNVVLFGKEGRNGYSENLTVVDAPFTVTISTEKMISGGVQPYTPNSISAIYIGIQPIGFAFAESFAIKRIWFE
jgi:hypothetical protein